MFRFIFTSVVLLCVFMLEMNVVFGCEFVQTQKTKNHIAFSLTTDGHFGFNDTTEQSVKINNPIFLQNGMVSMIERDMLFRGIDSAFNLHVPFIYVSQFTDSLWGDYTLTPYLFDFNNPKSLIGTGDFGKMVFFATGHKRSNIEIIEIKKSQRKETRAIEHFYNGGYSIQSGCGLSDNKIFVFSSNRVGSMGGNDLFIARYGTNNQWSISNIRSINSGFNEINPRISYNDSVLYFSSNRNGRYNIYYSRLNEQGQWETPLSFNKDGSQNELMFTPTTEKSSGFMLLSDSLFESKKIVPADGRRFEISTLNDEINLNQTGTASSKLKIKGIVTINKIENPTKIQISVVDSLGVLVQTMDLDSKTGYYEIKQIPGMEFLIVFSGSNVQSQTRKVKISPSYEYSVYYIDVTLASSYNPNVRVYDVVFELGKPELTEFQTHTLQEWLKLNKPTISDIWIRSAVVKKSKNSVLNKKRVAFLCNLVNSKQVDESVNRESDCDLDQCIENRTYQIVISAKKYPKYRVEEFDEDVTPSFQKSNTTFTIELERENEIHNLKQYAEVGVNTIWIDNSQAKPKYCLGRFGDYNNALLMIKELKNRGIRHLQIRAFDIKKNRVIPISNSTNLKKNIDISTNRYYVEIKASPVILETNNYPFREKIGCVLDLNGIYHYIYGDYNLIDAKLLCTQLKEKGFRSANVVTITK